MTPHPLTAYVETLNSVFDITAMVGFQRDAVVISVKTKDAQKLKSECYDSPITCDGVQYPIVALP